MPSLTVLMKMEIKSRSQFWSDNWMSTTWITNGEPKNQEDFWSTRSKEIFAISGNGWSRCNSEISKPLNSPQSVDKPPIPPAEINMKSYRSAVIPIRILNQIPLSKSRRAGNRSDTSSTKSPNKLMVTTLLSIMPIKPEKSTSINSQMMKIRKPMMMMNQKTTSKMLMRMNLKMKRKMMMKMMMILKRSKSEFLSQNQNDLIFHQKFKYKV